MPKYKRTRRHGNSQKLLHLITKLHWAVKNFWVLPYKEQHSQLRQCAQALHLNPTGARLRFLHFAHQHQVVTDFTQLTQYLELLTEDEVKEGDWLLVLHMLKKIGYDLDPRQCPSRDRGVALTSPP